MARAGYIYLIRHKDSHAILGGFTVKYEAHDWATNESGFPLDMMQLYRMRDGLHKDKSAQPLPWE